MNRALSSKQPSWFTPRHCCTALRVKLRANENYVKPSIAECQYSEEERTLWRLLRPCHVLVCVSTKHAYTYTGRVCQCVCVQFCQAWHAGATMRFSSLSYRVCRQYSYESSTSRSRATQLKNCF